jgi:hypothetical protein
VSPAIGVCDPAASNGRLPVASTCTPPRRGQDSHHTRHEPRLDVTFEQLPDPNQSC